MLFPILQSGKWHSKSTRLVDSLKFRQFINLLGSKNQLYGFESTNDFQHITDLQTFRKLQDL